MIHLNESYPYDSPERILSLWFTWMNPILMIHLNESYPYDSPEWILSLWFTWMNPILMIHLNESYPYDSPERILSLWFTWMNPILMIHLNESYPYDSPEQILSLWFTWMNPILILYDRQQKSLISAYIYYTTLNYSHLADALIQSDAQQSPNHNQGRVRWKTPQGSAISGAKVTTKIRP